MILLKDRLPDRRHLLTWKWSRGEATLKADFGDPLATTNYALCVYDRIVGTPTLRVAADIPAGDIAAAGRARKFDLVAVAALDRLGRNLRHLVTLLDEFQHLGIGLVSPARALDLTSPIGRAMFALVGVLAEVERAWIVERTYAGLRRSRAQGKRLGPFASCRSRY